LPEFHAEPYIYLPTITHKSALIAPDGSITARTGSII
jgi:hypothetical protein